MARDIIDLDGTWDFNWLGHAPDAIAQDDGWRQARVPLPWQAQFDDLREALGVAVYRRRFPVPDDWRDGGVWLCFGAVAYLAEVSVNGVPVVRHEGGWLPFEAEIGAALRADGDNLLEVRVTAPSDDAARYGDMALADTPFGKQSWYGPLGGIWQSVRLERRSAVHLKQLRLDPDLATGRVAVTVTLTPSGRPLPLDLEITGPDGHPVGAAQLTVAPGDREITAALILTDVTPWSPDRPTLYGCAAILGDDRIESAFGFRRFEARDGRFWLNGAPLHLRAALDQDYYPDGIATVPSTAFLEDQLRKAKALGLNCLRCHIKAPDPRYYEVADRLGMLIWTELPNGGIASEAGVARAEATLDGILARDFNHPSIVIWTIVNENWGRDLVHDATHRAWVKRMVARVRQADPGRLVVDNSPLWPSFHVQSDVADIHYYKAWPDPEDGWARFVHDYATGPLAQVYSPWGDAVIRGDEPRLISEFGGWGLPHPRDLADADGREPWWFETGHDWADGVMYPHGIEHRFRAAGLARVFGDLDGFVEACQWQQYHGLKHQIETMRLEPALAGYVITELTDAHWECNGLLDMRRNPRVFHDVFAAVNADRVLIPRVAHPAVRAGDDLTVALTLANAAAALPDGEIRATLDGLPVATMALPPVEAGAVVPLAPLRVTLPCVETPRLARLEIAAGAVTTHVELALHPARPAPVGGLVLWSDDPAIARWLAAQGYVLRPALADADLAVTAGSSPALEGFVRDGGAALIVADSPMTLQPLFPHWQNVQVRERAGSPAQGDWASAFAWLRRDGPYARLPGGPLLDASFTRVLPRCVIANCNALDFQARVQAGLVTGWIHKAVGLIVAQRYGRGRFVATTFRPFRDAPGTDPTAAALVDALVEHALAGRRQPAASPALVDA